MASPLRAMACVCLRAGMGESQVMRRPTCIMSVRSDLSAVVCSYCPDERTAKAGTVSVGKLTNFPDLALATKDIKETKATESFFLQIA